MNAGDWRVVLGIVLAGILVNGGWWLLQRVLLQPDASSDADGARTGGTDER